MRRIILINLTLILALALLPVLPAQAAPGDLVVEFESTPLFGQANFLPGDSISRYIKVTNNLTEIKPIGIEAINETNPDGLAEKIDFLIKEGATTLFSGTLKDFFDAGETSLSDLAGSGTQTQYDLTASFQAGSGNAYQNGTVGFDLLVGFLGEDGGEAGDGGGGGGGGGGGISGLTIHDEGAVTVTDTSATITWLTSYPSTSRVVYGTVPGVFDFSSPPDYGYSFSTLESDTPASSSGVTFHSVTLFGLTPGTTYYFRVISHASPDSISLERSFTTLSPAVFLGEVAAPSPSGAGPAGERVTGEPAGAIAGVVAVEEGAKGGTSIGGGTATDSLGVVRGEVSAEGGAAGGNARSCEPPSWWFLGYSLYALLLIVGYVALSQLSGRLQTVVLTVLAAAALAWWWWEPCGARFWLWPSAVIITYILALWFYSVGRGGDSQAQLPLSSPPEV